MEAISESVYKFGLDADGGDTLGKQTIAERIYVAGDRYINKHHKLPIEFTISGNLNYLGHIAERINQHQRMRLLDVSAHMDSDGGVTGDENDTSVYRLLAKVNERTLKGMYTSGSNIRVIRSAERLFKKGEGLSKCPIMGELPTYSGGKFYMMDVGATTNCDSKDLISFVHLGMNYLRNALHINEPRVGFVSNGSEDTKGNFSIKKAVMSLRKENINVKQVEAKHCLGDEVDLAIADGLLGNVAIKWYAAGAKFVGYRAVHHLKQNWLLWPLLPIALPVMLYIKHKIHKETSTAQGAVFHGYENAKHEKIVIVKGHGEANVREIYQGIDRMVMSALPK
jgi:fatty acid/phospholipid biosynthesis enzyme